MPGAPSHSILTRYELPHHDSFSRIAERTPDPIREAARKAYRLFVLNSRHPSLQFKLIDAFRNIYSVRIGLRYRALCCLEGDTIIWFWIGTHSQYDEQIGD